ncbi:MAG: Holliday junction resolvase RuvX [Clostridia bacterium]|nr:Holliday junction resolvase RuvX [Clostridia bacterium]
MRKMALDIGDVRIGIATSDPMGIIASGYETYNRKGKSDEEVADYMVEFAKANAVDTIVVGLPLNMDGTSGERVQIVKGLASLIAERTDIKIVYQDERLTTVTAERMLIEADMRRDKRKQVVDKVAASIILQCYLDRI